MHIPTGWLWSVRKWWVLLRDGKRQVLAAEALVASELESNALMVERLERGWETRQSMFSLLHFSAWDARSTQLHVLNKKQPGLWDELDRAYASLKHSAAGYEPETSSALRELAGRLRQVGY